MPSSRALWHQQLRVRDEREEYKQKVYRRFPEWSPQRHMFMDAPQRQAVRDLLGLATGLFRVAITAQYLG